jgi:hypothetical protein
MKASLQINAGTESQTRMIGNPQNESDNVKSALGCTIEQITRAEPHPSCNCISEIWAIPTQTSRIKKGFDDVFKVFKKFERL